ncbi:intradiol ring-cleavage dioxygenase [Paraburkholderia sp. J11-2]|uniref:intradiol ring-cleavage dioxygenase n=1 Tax=Paraburkholderia sp. J11-2 TaxID=2805431 RepID=UPI002AB6004D|nr:intradiol ring-cleavage dioxygenase [Paraburkholderia sp. J11-2]
MTSRLSRREFIKLTIALGTSAATLEASPAALASAPPCRLTPEQEVGPYWIDGDLVRTDVREGKPGVPLTLDIVLTDARTCAPLVGAAVDIWQCDAMGAYSGYTKMALSPPPDFDPKAPGRPPADWRAGPPPAPRPTDRETFLRGIQHTDRAGVVTFQTIVPGNYPGRTNHVHFKVRTASASHVSHVGQVFFPELLMVSLMQLDPYREHAIQRTTQGEDAVFVNQSGAAMIASASPFAFESRVNGFRARVNAVVDPDAQPQAVEPFPGPPPG